MPQLFTLALAAVVVIVPLLLTLTLGALVGWRPSPTGPLHAALGGVTLMIALIAVIVTATR
ncbi:hypothetical protein ABT010_39575 [Streptomyces sp. NPDC002668]|uniref:hypothetical protein n=1 Tax=Streptomyces sp. NPDC002668 TaxID=3154422 RepID=UPI00331B1642